MVIIETKHLSINKIRDRASMTHLTQSFFTAIKRLTKMYHTVSYDQLLRLLFVDNIQLRTKFVG